ncbi:hypothetical protein IW261DRAFT_1566951 [Armillaria novae-zelandiae]|uniref:Uncharacterized protein n=1 Tax=Armillaria novae-zelandiae TaxID=153914 RepID=A0AA39P4Q9_9AGAR|nr:hypothetical protein IW261DRAFT_1566951 [Armillaria novae-zelandiae]
MSSASYLAIIVLELQDPRWNTYIEFHRIVLSLPDVTELHIPGLTESNTKNMPVVLVFTTPRIKKMSFHVSFSTTVYTVRYGTLHQPGSARQLSAKTNPAEPAE